MLSRGRAANHFYLQIVGDGDPHMIIRPETVAPRTATEILQQILARDDGATSATTLLRAISDPTARLFSATPTAFMWRSSSWSDTKSCRCSTAEPTRSSPKSLASRRGRPYGHICSPWRPRPVSTHSSSCRQRAQVAN